MHRRSAADPDTSVSAFAVALPFARSVRESGEPALGQLFARSKRGVCAGRLDDRRGLEDRVDLGAQVRRAFLPLEHHVAGRAAQPEAVDALEVEHVLEVELLPQRLDLPVEALAVTLFALTVVFTAAADGNQRRATKKMTNGLLQFAQSHPNLPQDCLDWIRDWVESIPNYKGVWDNPAKTKGKKNKPVYGKTISEIIKLLNPGLNRV